LVNFCLFNGCQHHTQRVSLFISAGPHRFPYISLQPLFGRTHIYFHLLPAALFLSERL
jgi:hypothetical protein